MPADQSALPIGTTIGEFEIIDIIGWGGFGIVYLTYDHSLQRQVALKEYMPSALAVRDNTASITVKSAQNKETFEAGLRSFINEARLLAHFDHPSLVKVYRFWESNGTAYMVMPFYQGTTLKETLRVMRTPPDEAWLKHLLVQLLDALSLLHKDQCLHRDISPDNILILPDGRPLLLDFGAARRVISNMTHTLTVILKPGYAPIEQYAEIATMTQGPWTDIYALAAVLYFSITGQAPIPSVSRMISDTLIPLSKVAENRYSAKFLKGIDKALAIRPEDRPQNINELRELLGLPELQQNQQDTHSTLPGSISTPTAGAFIANHSKKPIMLYLAAFLTLIAIIGISVLLISKESEQPDLIAHSDTSNKAPFDPLNALNEIFDGRDRDHAVTVSVEKAMVRIGKDQLRFKIRSAKPGYAYILMVGTNHSDFFLLFPNAVDKDNYIEMNEQLELPRSKWRMISDGPVGTNHFIVIVSSQPRDFNHAGLQAIGQFSEFPFMQATQLHHNYTGSLPLFAGKAVCPSSLTTSCPESYGAAVFSIEEING